MRDCTQFYVNGAWVEPDSPQVLDAINPATEEAIGRIALGNAQDVQAAVAAAKAASLSNPATGVSGENSACTTSWKSRPS